jgi:hypothetical protein
MANEKSRTYIAKIIKDNIRWTIYSEISKGQAGVLKEEWEREKKMIEIYVDKLRILRKDYKDIQEALKIIGEVV